MHAYGLMIIDDRYIPINDLDDQIFVAKRTAHFLFPPAILVSSTSQSKNVYPDYLPMKRQSFGRRHHWDTYFGRRR
jgi:hypothetical protein